MIYTVFVPNYLKVANSPENSIENKIQAFIGSTHPIKIILTDDFLEKGEMLLTEPRSIYVDFLSHLPSELPQGTVAAALSERSDAQMQLLYSSAAQAPENFLQLHSAATILSISKVSEFQLGGILKTHTLLDYSKIENLIQAFNTYKCCAALIPACYSNFFVSETPIVSAQNFHFTELVPLVGSGVLCAVTRSDDTDTRKFLRPYHHAATAECVNIERQLKKLAHPHELNAFVYTDKQHYFHLHAAFLNPDLKLKKVQLSRSTTFELAETAWKELQE